MSSSLSDQTQDRHVHPKHPKHPKKIRIAFSDRERLLEVVEREKRAVDLEARLEATSSGHFNLVLKERKDATGKRPRDLAENSSRRNVRSFVDFKDSVDFNRFVASVHQHLIDLFEDYSDEYDECMVSLNKVKKHFYETNPPHAPKDTTAAFMNLVDKGFLEPVLDKKSCYRILV